MTRHKLTQARFSEVVQGMTGSRHVFGAVLRVESGDGSVSYNGASGDMQPGDSYFIASVTKLYVTAIMLILRQQAKLSFQDKLANFFPDNLIAGLHRLNGIDYTGDITIAHLMSNTSGLPDYFYYDKSKGDPVKSLMLGNDEPWPLEKAVASAKALTPKFRPGQRGKVLYSDTNYQLLGGIIERVTGLGIGEAFREYITEPLGLTDTYAFSDTEDSKPKPMYYGSQTLHAPIYMSSVTAEGGLVSTSADTMRFLKAFFGGVLFPVKLIDELTQNWNMILFPGQFFFGLGLEKLWTPRILSPFAPTGDVLGFWGQSGAFAFYNPQRDLYFTGTINQISGMGHSAAYKAIVQIIKSA